MHSDDCAKKLKQQITHTRPEKGDLGKFPVRILQTSVNDIKQQLYTYYMANYKRILIILSMFLISDKQNMPRICPNN